MTVCPPEWLPSCVFVAEILCDRGFRLHNVQGSNMAYIHEGGGGRPARVVQLPLVPDELEWSQICVIADESDIPFSEWVRLLEGLRITHGD